ncbi:MAG TPA: hypothetical protein VLG37_02275 [Candidatus Saccharimonadales bacterium]|nr:hypothetical protein [Candidatus Saccharimonadales bacterium]
MSINEDGMMELAEAVRKLEREQPTPEAQLLKEDARSLSRKIKNKLPGLEPYEGRFEDIGERAGREVVHNDGRLVLTKRRRVLLEGGVWDPYPDSYYEIELFGCGEGEITEDTKPEVRVLYNPRQSPISMDTIGICWVLSGDYLYSVMGQITWSEPYIDIHSKVVVLSDFLDKIETQ